MMCENPLESFPMRVSATLALSLFLVGTTGCGKDEEPEVIYVTRTASDTTDTYVPPPPKVFTEMRMIGFVAWDPTSGEIQPYSYQGGSRSSRLEIRLYEDGIDSDFCTVFIYMDGMTESPTAKTEGYAWGVDIPSGTDKSWAESCTEAGWDVDQFPEGRGIEDWAGYDYHLRFYTGMDQDLIDWLTPDNTATFEINHYTGGYFFTDTGGISTDENNNYWYGYELDGNWDVDPSVSAPLDQRYTMLDVNGDMVRGYFVFDQRVFWEF